MGFLSNISSSNSFMQSIFPWEDSFNLYKSSINLSIWGCPQKWMALRYNKASFIYFAAHLNFIKFQNLFFICKTLPHFITLILVAKMQYFFYCFCRAFSWLLNNSFTLGSSGSKLSIIILFFAVALSFCFLGNTFSLMVTDLKVVFHP